ncbi:MAG: 3-isopropylmalate dehydratase large subunit, partial [Synergistaceae bacterium]|nr:3-isopropylmalate dehydratase large subunit [Synergistaceae bacterium]
MARTLVEAIIAAHTRDEVQAGNICKVAVDFAFANDITAPPAIREFKKMGGVRVFDPARCAIVP